MMKFGLVGVGCIGQLRAQAIRQSPDCSLASVFDLKTKLSQGLAAEQNCDVDVEYAALLDRNEIDAIVVSSPPQFHEEQVTEALSAGKHVLCEKPMSNNVASCGRMLEAARNAGRVLAVGFNHRFFPAIQYAKETLDSGRIGELDHIRAFGGHVGLSEFRSEWEYDRDIIGGGALMDVGIHLIDLTRYFLGEIAEVYGMITTDVWNLNGAEDNGLVLMRNFEGKCATLQATWTEWKGYRFHIELYGSKGMVRAYYAPMSNSCITMDRPGGATKKERKYYPHIMLREKLLGWQSTAVKTFIQEFAEFVDLCQGQRGKIADGVDGFRAVEIAHAVYRSSRENIPVQLLDLKKSNFDNAR